MRFDHIFLQGHLYLIYKRVDTFFISIEFLGPGYRYKRGNGYVFI
jgi:hypothetical protein